MDLLHALTKTTFKSVITASDFHCGGSTFHLSVTTPVWSRVDLNSVKMHPSPPPPPKLFLSVYLYDLSLPNPV